MNRDIMLVCNSIMLLIILIVYTAIYYWGKKKKKAVWIEFLGWTGIAVAAMVVFNTIYIENWDYDRFGNAYINNQQDSDDSSSEELNINCNLIFQDADGSRYVVRENQVVSINDSKQVAGVRDCYLNNKGLLEFDTAGNYIQTSDENIFINTKGRRVYTLWSCWWTWWGKFNSPENAGIYVGNCYIQPMNGSFNPDILENVFLFLLCFATICVPVYPFFSAIRCMYRSEKIPEELYDKIIIHSFAIMESVFLLTSLSMIGFLTILPICLVCSYAIIPLLNGGVNLENKEGNLADLYISEIRSHADTVHVNCLRKKCMFTCSRYFVYWLVLTVVHSAIKYLYL